MCSGKDLSPLGDIIEGFKTLIVKSGWEVKFMYSSRIVFNAPHSMVYIGFNLSSELLMLYGILAPIYK